MKTILSFANLPKGAIILLIFLLSCNQVDDELTLGEYRVTYEVTTESGRWYGNYINARGNAICVCDDQYEQSGWLHSFASPTIPAELSITVNSQYLADSTVVDKPDVTASIYLNGELLVTQTNSISDGKTRVTALNPELPTFE